MKTRIKSILVLLTFITLPRVAFADVNMCPETSFAKRTFGTREKTLEKTPNFAIGKVTSPNSRRTTINTVTTIPQAKTQEEFVRLFFEKYTQELGIQIDFSDLRLVSNRFNILRYKPYYRGMPVIDTYFDFRMKGTSTMVTLQFNESPIHDFSFKNTPTDPTATVDAVVAIVTKESAKLTRTLPAEPAIVVKEGTAYAAWVVHVITGKGAWIVVALDQDHTIYSATCSPKVGNLETILARRILK